MPIRWSALKVSEAMDMVEEFVEKAAEPLECARIVANEARRIPNLPQYLDQRLIHLITDIERIDYVKRSIKAVRNDIPDGAIEEERELARSGSQLTLAS